MSYSSMNDLVAALDRRQLYRFYKNSLTAEGAGTFHSLWIDGGQPTSGATPAAFGSNGAIPTNATAGAVPFLNAGASRELKLCGFALQGATAGVVTLYDRLWHCSGFSLVSTSAQTIPSFPALTRPDALGAGVELWGEVYTAGGATGTVMTVLYTNQDGTAGRSATYTQPANALAVGQMVRFDLQAGDTGVRAIASLTLSISTGTAGDFGLTLVRPVAVIPLPSTSTGYFQDLFQLGLGDVHASACLAFQVLCSATNTGLLHGALILGEN